MAMETESDGVPSYLQPDKEPDFDSELNLPSAPTGHAAPAGRANNQVLNSTANIYIHSSECCEKYIESYGSLNSHRVLIFTVDWEETFLYLMGQNTNLSIKKGRQWSLDSFIQA
jgi:hypothetical protein